MKAIILAGGLNPRTGTFGKFIPRELFPIPNDDVEEANRLVPIMDRLISQLKQVNDIDKIYILIKGDVSKFKSQFNNWKWQYVGDSRVSVQDQTEIHNNSGIDETQLSGRIGADKGKAVLGIYELCRVEGISEDLLIVAGDNYLEEGFENLVNSYHADPKITIGYSNLLHKEMIRVDENQKSHYGIIALGTNGRITEFKEKPNLTTNNDKTTVALKCYVLTKDGLEKLKSYVKDKNNKGDLGSPGCFFEWLINIDDEEPVYGYEFKAASWDINSPSDYINIFRVISAQQTPTVRDLIEAKKEGRLTDDTYFVGREIKFTPDGQGNWQLVIHFKSSDKVLKRELIAGHIERTKDPKCRLAQLANQINGFQDDPPLQRFTFSQETGVLLSGGVFLYDGSINNHGRLNDNAFIPLLERDLGAPADRGRLTTPAGRMDNLDLLGFCFSELLEELVFYGDSGNNIVNLFTVFPPELVDYYKPQQQLLNRLVEKNINIPGIDQSTLRQHAKEKNTSLIQNIDNLNNILTNNAVDLKNLPVWEVAIVLDGVTVHEQKMYVVADADNATLEFRAVYAARLSGNPSQPDNVSGQLRIGKLMGIADGDGYQRRTLLVSAKELADYYTRNHQPSPDVTPLFTSQKVQVKLAAVGDGNNSGRFSQLNVSVPGLFLTTSVTEMAKLTTRLIP